MAYTQYIGFTNDYDDSYLLCNAWIGKKIFKNKRGEIMFGVNDLLNRNKAFARTTGSGWTQNATNSVIGRYYMVQFTYNLRRFGKKGSKNISDYDGAVQSGPAAWDPAVRAEAASGYLPRSGNRCGSDKKTSGAMPDVFLSLLCRKPPPLRPCAGVLGRWPSGFCGRDGAVPADAWASPSLSRFGGVRRRDVVLVRAVEHQVDADAGQTAVYEGQNAEHPDFGQHFGERRSHALDADAIKAFTPWLLGNICPKLNSQSGMPSRG